jgi:hypothetical protein
MVSVSEKSGNEGLEIGGERDGAVAQSQRRVGGVRRRSSSVPSQSEPGGRDTRFRRTAHARRAAENIEATGKVVGLACVAARDAARLDVDFGKEMDVGLIIVD